MRIESALIACVLVAGASCQAIPRRSSHQRHLDLHMQMRRDAEAVVHQRQRRENVDDVFAVPNGIWPTVAVPAGYTLAAGVMITPIPGASTTPATAAPTTAPTAVPTFANGTINMQAWDRKAEAACMNAMQDFEGDPGNPSGLAVCYNVPYLNMTIGTFEAELRLYNLSAPTGDFAGISADMMEVTLEYAGASIQASNGSALPIKRDLANMQKRQAATMTTANPSTVTSATVGLMMAGGAPVPTQLAIRRYVGAINENILNSGLNLTAMQPLLVPQISISAMNPLTRQMVNTSLSSTQASFVAGFFSQAAGTATTPQELLGKPAEDLAAAAQGLPTPFVVPGLRLNAGPVGLIVTSIWTIIFSLAVGLGTLGRVQFREQYRRAVKEQQTANIRRF